MTSKDNKPSGDARDIPSDINTNAVSLLRSRAEKIRTILDPGRLPTVQELLAGYPFYGDDLQRDLVSWCETSRHEKDCPAPVAIALQIVRDRQDLDSLAQAESVLHDHGWQTTRLLIYRACLGDQPAAGELADHIDPGIAKAQQSFLGLIKFAIAIGLRTGGLSCMDGALEAGMDDLQALSVNLSAWQKAEAWFLDQPDAPDQAALDALFLEAMGDEKPTAPTPATQTMVVVSEYVKPPGTGDRSRPKLDYYHLAGQALPLVMTGDLRAQKQVLLDRAPHLEPIADALLTDVGTGPVLRIKPTILVGEPGTGKSWIARQFADAVGAPISIYGAAGLADGTFLGTAAHWSTSNPSMPTTFIRQCGVANPIVCIDEVDKAVASQNGSLHDALLPFLDRGNAAKMRDPCLEVDVDLSAVNYLMTANSVEGIPAPLKDRCRILRVPNPEWKHVGVLSRQIIAAIARDRQVDVRMYPPLAQDELEVLKGEWNGGSIRKLRRALEATIDAREAYMKGAAS